jgi:multicomponent Na+:H+ antiporter subunit E
MKNLFGLTLILASFWMINSGYFKPFFLICGTVSVIITLYFVIRMTKQDGEQFPLIMPTLRLPGYLLWMMGQIIKSNIEVTKLIWQGDKAISPTIVTVKATQKSEVARVLYANSITMTPGTITLAVKDKDIEVHALTKEGAASLKTGDMDKRVTALEGGK